MVKNISSKKLFYGNKELSEILFLYNILLEDRRYNDSARFSFADYKQVRKIQAGIRNMWLPAKIMSQVRVNKRTGN